MKTINLKYSLLSATMLFASVSLFANGNEVKPKGAHGFSIAPKTISLVESNDIISLKTRQGDCFALPKVEKKINAGSMAIPFESLISLSDDLSWEKLQEELSLREEMKELSLRLGIKNIDPKYIDLYREAVDWLGTKYRRGGMSKTGVDCSGFTNIIYNTVFDKKLPRVSTDIANNLDVTLPADELEPGDLVFFCTRGRKHINHVGVYIGDGRFVHASIKKGVVVATLTEGYYNKALRKAGRIE